MACLSKRFALALLSSFAALVAAECALRDLRSQEWEHIYALRSDIVRLVRPTSIPPGPAIELATDRHGFRKHAASRQPGGVTIGIYGDSCVMAEFSEAAETFAARLEHHACARFGRLLRSLNAGVAGYGPDQALLRYLRDAEAVNFNGILLVLFADNDLGDLARNRLLRSGPGGELVRLRARIDPALRKRFSPGLSRLFLFRGVKRALETWRKRGSSRNTEHLSREVSSLHTEQGLARIAACEEEVRELYRPQPAAVKDLLGDHYDWDVACAPHSWSARAKIELLTSVLKRLRAETAARGDALAILILPSRFDACDAAAAEVAERARALGHSRSRLSALLAEVCAGLGIDHLNLWPAFSAADSCALYFPPPDNHWNAAGQDLAARRTADWLMALGWL